MALFEVMSALAVTFAIGIPTFMEKVMRPKYEERFSEFREARRDSFIDELEKALRRLKQSRKEMTPETIESMESLFNEWGQIKSDENKLTFLLKYRKFLFIGWLLSCATSLLSTQYSENLVLQNPIITLGQLSILVFCALLATSAWYGYELFNLDEILSKTRTRATGETFGKVENVQSSLSAYYEGEQKVEDALKQFQIPYSKETAITYGDSYVTLVDFAIPNGKSPRYVIEVKARFVSNTSLRRTSERYQMLKQKNAVMTILIVDISKLKPAQLRFAQVKFDAVVDLGKLETLKELIKL